MGGGKKCTLWREGEEGEGREKKKRGGGEGKIEWLKWKAQEKKEGEREGPKKKERGNVKVL